MANRLEDVFQEELVRLAARDSVAALDDVLREHWAWDGWVDGAVDGEDVTVRIHREDGVEHHVSLLVGTGRHAMRRVIEAAVKAAGTRAGKATAGE